MNENFNIPPFLKQIIVIAVIFVAIFGMKFTAPILGLILLSIFLSMIIYPFLKWLENKGLSYNKSILVTLVGIFILGLSILGFLVVTLAQLVKALPNMSIHSSSFLAQYGNQIIQFLASNVNSSSSEGLIASGIFIIFAVPFLIYEVPQIKIRLTKGLGTDSPLLKRIFTLVNTFIKYFLIRVKVNLIYGVGVAGVLFLFDINFAVLWGMLTFFLGFIPYLGIFLAAIPPILVVWSKYGIQSAVIMALFFITINTIVESYVFPRLTGKGLQLSIYVVFISVFVWGWILGAPGFLLGVPLTLIVIKYLENFKETRWLALLMISEDNKDVEVIEDEKDNQIRDNESL